MAARIHPGVNDLNTTHPDLVTEWDQSNSKTPVEVVAGSTYQAMWNCPQGHQYRTSVRHRAKRGQGCPYCCGQRVQVGVSDLNTTHPDIISQWSPRNTTSPQEYSAGSGRKVWWVCDRNHEWEEVVELRTRRGYGCPYCSGHRATLEKSLATQFPQMAAEWDQEKNWQTPDQVNASAHILAWWTCAQGHSWRTMVYNRTNHGKGCPVCAGQKVLQGFNDLDSQFPEVAQEFDTSKNAVDASSVHCRSTKKYWWKCQNNHSWKSSLYSRTVGGSQCVQCSLHGISRAEKEISELVQEWGFSVQMNRRDLIPPYEIDIYVPEMRLGIEFNGLLWHSERYTKNKNKHFEKWQRAHDVDIQLIQIWEDEWNNKKDIIINLLKTKLGVRGEYLGARSTTVTTVAPGDAAGFLNSYHIQGSVRGCLHIGLVHKDDLIALMSLRPQGNQVILDRYATSVRVQGGFTKLLKHVRKMFPGKDIVTFADLCVSNGALYARSGFAVDRILPPDYKYIHQNHREHKFNYRLKRFAEDDSLIFRQGMTEHELARMNNLYRIYDAGKIRFVLRGVDDDMSYTENQQNRGNN